MVLARDMVRYAERSGIKTIVAPYYLDWAPLISFYGGRQIGVVSAESAEHMEQLALSASPTIGLVSVMKERPYPIFDEEETSRLLWKLPGLRERVFCSAKGDPRFAMHIPKSARRKVSISPRPH